MDVSTFDAIHDDDVDGVGQAVVELDENGQPIDPDAGGGDDEPELDDYDNPVGTEYDENGDPTNLDDEGKLIAEEDEEDEHGNPVGTEYDDDGEPTNLDEDGKLISTDDSPSVMTQFFDTQFGVKDGKIPFEDGTEMILDDMTPEQQLEALKFYTEDKVNTASGRVTPGERTILDEIRKSGKSFNDLVLDEVNTRMTKQAADQELGSVIDYKQVADEKIYELFIKENKPDITAEELTAAMEAGKTHPAYDATVNQFRNHLEQTQTAKRTKWEADRKADDQKVIDEDRNTLIEAARNLETVAGWPLNDDIKNDILGGLVEVDGEGNSPFMKEVFGDANKMIQASWYMKYGESYFQELNNHWKKQNDELAAKVAELEKNGGKPTPKKGMKKPGVKTPVSANRTTVRNNKRTGGNKKTKTLSEIHGD